MRSLTMALALAATGCLEPSFYGVSASTEEVQLDLTPETPTATLVSTLFVDEPLPDGVQKVFVSARASMLRFDWGGAEGLARVRVTSPGKDDAEVVLDPGETGSEHTTFVATDCPGGAPCTITVTSTLELLEGELVRVDASGSGRVRWEGPNSEFQRTPELTDEDLRIELVVRER